MTHPIINKIVNEGVDSVQLSALPKEVRSKLFTEAGNTLLHKRKLEEAAKCFALAENRDALLEHGRWYMKQQLLGAAAMFLLHVEDEEKLEELAKACIASNDIAAAKAIYSKLGNEVMLHFINKNF